MISTAVKDSFDKRRCRRRAAAAAVASKEGPRFRDGWLVEEVRSDDGRRPVAARKMSTKEGLLWCEFSLFIPVDFDVDGRRPLAPRFRFERPRLNSLKGGSGSRSHSSSGLHPYSMFCACEEPSREAILGRLARSWWIADLEDILMRNI